MLCSYMFIISMFLLFIVLFQLKYKMAIEEFRSQEAAAPFNMAIATLYSLRDILTKITGIYGETDLPDYAKQKLKINLLKRFYIDASPLLPQKIVDKFKGVLKLEPQYIQMMDNSTGNLKKSQNKRLIYDIPLEIKLDTYLIDIQMELQKEKYYMPPKQDKGTAVGRF